jgi:crossover junction endodeoxyribonuclease RuvC
MHAPGRNGASLPRRNVRLTSVPVVASRQRREQAVPAVASSRVRILGLDPGSRATGFAVLDCNGSSTAYVASGAIRTSAPSFPRRLEEIFSGVASLVAEHRPDEVAIERVFMHRNPDSALKLGQARGAALCGTFSGGARVFEYAAREVKLAVVGTGAAQKEQVQLMVRQLLKLTGALGPDAADALAIALCHANTRRLASLVQAAGAVRQGSVP